MAFDLSQYETVDVRIRRIREMYPDSRIVTVDYTNDNDRAMGIWRVKASIFLTAGDQANDLPSATGHAFEVDGGGGSIANKFAALENCETSAVGRAAAILFGAKASAEEMQKVERGNKRVAESASVPPNFRESVASAATTDELKTLWDEAVAGGFSKQVTSEITARKKELSE
jgi:hypothetical protein